MNKLKLYNSLSRQIEEFRPLNPPEVTMYTCGPTVYDFAHIGHFRTYVNTDLLRRALEYNGFKVFQVMNITDVGHLLGDRDLGEDKIEMAAKKEKKSAWDLAKFYENDFWQAMDGLNVIRPTVVCQATKHIKEMIELIRRLEEKGFTYQTSDGIYFDTAKFENYNKLSGMPLEKLKEGARVEPNPQKKNPTDFALWKFTPKGVKRQMEWNSPWGIGFPGWHIECSAMSMKYLGETFDIHTGGIDHIPVHHTNEIAQSEAATGKKFVNFWFHNAFLKVEGQKMSKSLGNIFNRQDIKGKGFSLLDCRYLFLTTHYRQKLNFTWESLKASQSALAGLRGQISNLKSQISNKRGAGNSCHPEFILEPVLSSSQESIPKQVRNDVEGISSYQKRFREYINNDLAIPQALALMWEVIKSNIPPGDKLDLILNFDQIFGLKLAEVERKETKVPQRVRELVEKREKLRQEKKWQLADRFRKKVNSLGFVIEDTSEGPRIRQK